MTQQSRILIVDDDPIVAESIAEFLNGEGYETATACDGNEALEILDSVAFAVDQQSPSNGSSVKSFGLVMADLNMPRLGGMEMLKIVRKQYPSLATIIITGYGKIESAVEAVRAGAVDYLTKPLIDDELRISVNKAMQQHTLLAENQHLRDQLSERFGLGAIVGSDHKMQRVYDLIEAVADSKTTVLITGKSGTGKSMTSHAIHERSTRRTKPFVTFACGAIPETLLESELFGHVKGAFTGADYDKPGKILSADGGTLFIDEINSATPALQLKLLRVLQERKFEPVGSSQTIEVDIRFILASNQSLKDLVAQGLFREDLYYRINVVNIELPELRERISDIPDLADHLIEKHCRELERTITGLTDDALGALQRYDWPGNVRELENAIERAVVLSRRPVIDVEDLPEPINEVVDSSSVSMNAMRNLDSAVDGLVCIPALANDWTAMPLSEALEEPERQIILAALEANNWNRQLTAGELDINRTTLYKKIKKYHLDEPG